MYCTSRTDWHYFCSLFICIFENVLLSAYFNHVREMHWKKENNIFLIYKEIQMGAVARSYMRKGFLIYEEMRKYLVIYEEAVSHIWLCHRSLLDFLSDEKNFILFFISVGFVGGNQKVYFSSILTIKTAILCQHYSCTAMFGTENDTHSQ